MNFPKIYLFQFTFHSWFNPCENRTCLIFFRSKLVYPFQVVRLASFQHAPSVPPYLTLPKQSKVDGDDSGIPKEIEDRKVNEIAVGGGGVSVAVTRFPTEQKRPVGPLVVVGVRDGVLWLIDR